MLCVHVPFLQVSLKISQQAGWLKPLSLTPSHSGEREASGLLVAGRALEGIPQPPNSCDYPSPTNFVKLPFTLSNTAG